MKVFIVLLMAGGFLFLIRRNLLQIDLSFPLFFGFVVLAFASLSERFVQWLTIQLGFAEQPFAIFVIAIAILLTIVVGLSIAVSRLRHRQLLLVRYLAQEELHRQITERRLNQK